MLRKAVSALGMLFGAATLSLPAVAAPGANSPTAIASQTAPAGDTGQSGDPADAAAGQSRTNPDLQRLAQITRQLAARDGAQAADGQRTIAATVGSPSTGAAYPGSGAITSASGANERLPLGRGVASPDKGGDGQDDAAHTGMHSRWGWISSTIAALGAVIGLILLLRAVISRITGRSMTPARTSIAEVLSRISLGPRSHILVVRLGRRILLLGEAPTGLSTLANIDDPEEVAGLLQSLTASGSNSASSLFTQTLAGFDGEYEDLTEEQPAGEGQAGGVRIQRARDGVSSLAAKLRVMTGKGAGR